MSDEVGPLMVLSQIFFSLAWPFIMLMVGYLAGSAAERSHFRRLAVREKRLAGFIVTDLKSYAPGLVPAKGGVMVTGGAVIATDYMKTFLAAIRKILGGELKSFETLMDRARREATLRMLEEAERQGFNAVCNLRLETADIGGMTGAKGAAMAEAFVYGTAFRIDRDAA